MKCESERWMHFFQFSKWRSNVGSLLTNWLTCIAAQHYFCFLIVTYVLVNFSVSSLLTNWLTCSCPTLFLFSNCYIHSCKFLCWQFVDKAVIPLNRCTTNDASLIHLIYPNLHVNYLSEKSFCDRCWMS